MTACRREPSGRRASTIGDERSSRRPKRCDDPLDQVHDRVGVELEDDGLEPAGPLDVGAARTVDHDLGDGRVGEQWLERTEAGDLVRELLEQRIEADGRQQRLLVAEKLGQASAERDGVIGRADVVGTLRDQAVGGRAA